MTNKTTQQREVDNSSEVRTLLDFSKPENVYIMMLKRRNSDNGDKYDKKDGINNAVRKVITSVNDYDYWLEELKKMAEFKSLGVYRIYLTVNPRSTVKAYSILSSEVFVQLGNINMYDLLKNFHSKYKSKLHATKSYANYFILDFDKIKYKDVRKQLIKKIEAACEIKVILPSKSGVHVIVRPFNPKKLLLEKGVLGLEIKQDAMTNVYIGTTNPNLLQNNNEE